MTDCGYPLEWFVEPIDAYLVCGICGNVLRDPKATECGHVFCHKCIHSWIDEYGVCPARCGEVEVEHLHRASHIQKKISCLLTGCKFTKTGCKAILKLVDKELHEQTCHYGKKLLGKARSFAIFNFGHSQQEVSFRRQHTRTKSTGHHKLSTVNQSEKATIHSQVTNQRRSNSIGFGGFKIPGLSKRTPSKPVLVEKPKVSKLQKPKVSKPMRMQSQHTYRLKRTKPRESLGLVLVSGDKTPDGRPVSFYVKGVNRDTLAWKAGMKPGDKIVQVDYYNLTAIPPQEAVARIKDKQVVTLTILRGLVPPSKDKDATHDHIYDEIMYADQQLSQNLSQQEDFSQFMTTGFMTEHLPNSHRQRTGQLSERDLLKLKTTANSPSIGTREARHFTYPTVQSCTTQGTLPGEKGSKDSGLSSGSSDSPEQQRVRMLEQQGVEYPEDAPFERLANLRQSYRTEREMVKNFLKSQKKQPENVVIDKEEVEHKRNCRIEGEYEVEEIYLQKNGTSQLGVTLGYDTKTPKGHLYVCEILPTGLAYQDGRLKCGDIIRRVNGFEVHDPEEAILLFLEQDQDITLTVARKIKPVSNRLILSNQATVQPAIEHTYAVLEDKVNGGSTPLRRIDSCGSLDSRSHKYAELEKPTETAQRQRTDSVVKINDAGYEFMNPSNHPLQDSSRQLMVSPSPQSTTTARTPPRNLSPLCYSMGQTPQSNSSIPSQNTTAHSQRSQSTSSHRTPSPIRHTPSPSPICHTPSPLPIRHTPSPDVNSRIITRATSQERLATMAVNKQLSNPLPDNRHKMNRANYEHKNLAPSTSADGVRKAKSFRTLLEANTCKLAMRSDSNNDLAFCRSESLV